MSTQRIYEGDTVRITLSDLAHDEVGVMAANADVDWTAYRAAGTSLDTGTATYNPRLKSWADTVTAPATVATNPETILVEFVVTAAGATHHFRTTFDVYEAGP